MRPMILLLSLVMMLACAILPMSAAVACDNAAQFNSGYSGAQNFRAQQNSGGCYAQNFRAQQNSGHHAQNFRAQQNGGYGGGGNDDFRQGFNAGQRAQQNGGGGRVTTVRSGLFGRTTTTIRD